MFISNIIQYRLMLLPRNSHLITLIVTGQFCYRYLSGIQ